jgi:hypothetical protein
MGSESSRKGASTVQVVLFIAAAVLVFVAEQFNVPAAGDWGMVFFGALIVTVGVGMFASRLGVFQIDGWTEAKVVETYRGIIELIWASLCILLGLGLSAGMLLKQLLPGFDLSHWGNVLGSTTGIGLMAAIVGLLTLLNGLVRALAGSRGIDPQKLGGMPYFLDRLAGAGVLLLGGIISGVAILLLIAPEIVTSALDGLKNLVLGP